MSVIDGVGGGIKKAVSGARARQLLSRDGERGRVREDVRRERERKFRSHSAGRPI